MNWLSIVCSEEFRMGGRLTYDPGVEEVPPVWGGVVWGCDRHFSGPQGLDIVPKEKRMFGRTLCEVGLCGGGGDANWKRTTIEFGGMDGSSEGASDEGTNGKDRGESNHR